MLGGENKWPSVPTKTICRNSMSGGKLLCYQKKQKENPEEVAILQYLQCFFPRSSRAFSKKSEIYP